MITLNVRRVCVRLRERRYWWTAADLAVKGGSSGRKMWAVRIGRKTKKIWVKTKSSLRAGGRKRRGGNRTSRVGLSKDDQGQQASITSKRRSGCIWWPRPGRSDWQTQKSQDRALVERFSTPLCRSSSVYSMSLISHCSNNTPSNSHWPAEVLSHYRFAASFEDSECDPP